jgi:hypothetical protein
MVLLFFTGFSWFFQGLEKGFSQLILACFIELCFIGFKLNNYIYAARCTTVGKIEKYFDHIRTAIL